MSLRPLSNEELAASRILDGRYRVLVQLDLRALDDEELDGGTRAVLELLGELWVERTLELDELEALEAAPGVLAIQPALFGVEE